MYNLSLLETTIMFIAVNDQKTLKSGHGLEIGMQYLKLWIALEQ